MYFGFSNPANLLFLFLLPVIIFFHFFGLRNLKGRALKFANFEAIYNIRGIDLFSKNITTLIFDIIIFISLVFALSGITFYRSAQTTDFSYVIAIDTSESMQAQDFQPSRLQAAKSSAIDFLNDLGYESRIGILSFAGDGLIEQEITSDKGLIIDAISKIQQSPISGTDFYEAAILSSYMLKDEENKALIIFSDGQINTAGLEKSIAHFQDNGIVVYTIGMGTLEGGNVSFGISKIDLDSLKSIAYNTGGKFISTQGNEELSANLKNLVGASEQLIKNDLSNYLMIFVIILFSIRSFLMSSNKISW